LKREKGGRRRRTIKSKVIDRGACPLCLTRLSIYILSSLLVLGVGTQRDTRRSWREYMTGELQRRVGTS